MPPKKTSYSVPKGRDTTSSMPVPKFGDCPGSVLQESWRSSGKMGLLESRYQLHAITAAAAEYYASRRLLGAQLPGVRSNIQ